MVPNQSESQNVDFFDTPSKKNADTREKPVRKRTVKPKDPDAKEIPISEDKVKIIKAPKAMPAKTEPEQSEAPEIKKNSADSIEPAITPENIAPIKPSEQPNVHNGYNNGRRNSRNIENHNANHVQENNKPEPEANYTEQPRPKPPFQNQENSNFNNQNNDYNRNYYNNQSQNNYSNQNANNYSNNYNNNAGGTQHNTQQNTNTGGVMQHQYVEVAKGYSIQALKTKECAELITIAKELNISTEKCERKNDYILKIIHEQIRRAGGFAAEGVLDILEDGYGFLRTASYSMNEKDVYVSPSQIRRFDLRTGDIVIGQTRAPKEGEKFAALLRIEAINFEEPDKMKYRKLFDNLVPYYPDEKFTLESKKYIDISPRIIDLLSPVGKGQRGLIVAPPKAGKTTLLKAVANSIIANHPEVELMILLIDERPEEVTDMKRSVNAEVISSTFDEPLEHHIKVSELTLEKAKRMVENNKDVVILLDSITRLARAYNLQLPSSGQTLTGGVNPAALYKPKKFFGAARNIEGGGSLTILATALVETGSKLDDIIFEEFKGTGNMELVLDRKLFEKRLFPCIDIKRTGTRKEELLLSKEVLNKVWVLRKILDPLSPAEAMQLLIDRMTKTKTNKEFMEAMHVNGSNS